MSNTFTPKELCDLIEAEVASVRRSLANANPEAAHACSVHLSSLADKLVTRTMPPTSTLLDVLDRRFGKRPPQMMEQAS